MLAPKIEASAFNLSSSYLCQTTALTMYADSTQETVTNYSLSTITSTPNTAQRLVDFEAVLPENATVTRATVYAKLGNPMYGADICTINGVHADVGGDREVDVTSVVKTAIESGDHVVSVPFTFRSNAVEHHHDVSTEMTLVSSNWNALSRTLTEKYEKRHSGSLSISGVYLLIEYEGGAGYVHRAEGGKLVPYRLCRAEGGKLVPYRLHRAESGKLVPY